MALPVLRTCTRCVYTTRFQSIRFDESGVCNFCYEIDRLRSRYVDSPSGGLSGFARLLGSIRENRGKARYDCVVGVSGGTDSSYLLLKAVEFGLKPLAVHYDNTWNSATASSNIFRVCRALDVDLHTVVVDNKEVDDIKRAFLRAGVLEFDVDTDLAYVQVLRSAAARAGTRHILEGHSFLTEGISPVNENYGDGAYIRDVHRRFGEGPLRTFPNLTLTQFLKWAVFYRQVFHRPLWFLDYSKEAARDELVSKTGWRYYGGHHLENRASAFTHSVWLPRRFKLDYRNLALAASVRAGRMTREMALSILSEPPQVPPDLINYVQQRLGLDAGELEGYLSAPIRTWREFHTYKRTFERMRPIFAVLASRGRVPVTFYNKYCFPLEAP